MQGAITVNNSTCNFVVAVTDSDDREEKNKLWTWGWNFGGQLMVGDTQNVLLLLFVVLFRGRGIPNDIAFFHDKQVFSVASGSNHALFVTDCGLFGAGSNAQHQLAQPKPHKNFYAPVKIDSFDDKTICGVACGGQNSFVVTEQHGVWIFGSNDKSGLGVLETVKSPKQKVFTHEQRQAMGRERLVHCSQISEPTRHEYFDGKVVKALIAFTSHCFALVSQGSTDTPTLIMFGSNSSKQLDPSSSLNSIDLPTEHPYFADTTVHRVAVGYNHSLVLSSKGLFGFGEGFGDSIVHFDFFDYHKIRMFACGGSHSVVVTDDGVYSFGGNSNGQKSIRSSAKPVVEHERSSASIYQVEFQDSTLQPNKIHWTGILAGSCHTFLRSSDAIYCCGRNACLQLAFGSNTQDKLLLVRNEFFDRLVVRNPGWTLPLYRKPPWETERLLWIAKLKPQQDDCFVSALPREIIRLLLSFCFE